MGNNNSSLYMYDIEKDEVVPDYFLAQNGRGLGDTAQDMIVYGDKMYIAVYGESTIEVTDLKAKSIKQVKTEGQPRYMVSEGGKVYISYYNGYVDRLDTASLEVEAKVKVGIRNNWRYLLINCLSQTPEVWITVPRLGMIKRYQWLICLLLQR